MLDFSQKLSEDILRAIYEKLKLQKNNAKALKAIEEDFLLSEMLCPEKQNKENLSAAEQKIMDILKKQKLPAQKLSEGFQKYYGITENDLPKLFYSDGTEASTLIAVYLLSAHGCGIFAEYKKEGISSDAEAIVVSEETGKISYVKNGNVTPIQNINELKLLLNTSFGEE